MVTRGTNRVIGTDPTRIREGVYRALVSGSTSRVIPPLWNGRAADRIVRILTGVGGDVE